jgi:hypothetical protein
MPELKRLFLKGRMNKDLDERLVPNGEYRDALNIQVGSSESSDVGAIQNILGNQVRKEKKGAPSLDWALDSETANYYGLPLDAKCIGGIKDDINDRLYWFVTSSTVDCILEYEDTYKVVRPVLVDTQNILNFSANKLITGVNILDNYLFWTDDNSEPKKLEVTRGVFSTANFTTHSTYEGRNFIESDVTVIKKSPKSPPSMELFNSERDINGITNVETRANINFSNITSGQIDDKAIKNSVGVTSIILVIPGVWPPLTQTTYPLVTFDDAAYQVSDKIVLRAEAPETDLVNDSYYVQIEIWTKINSSNYTYIVRAISPQVPDDDDFTWTLSLEQEKYPFELKFPRFAYRWQYNDNQYSCFSPFTEVAFLPTVFKYNKEKGYNAGMVNTTRLINLNSFESPPVDVKKIEIVYKETNNPTIYVVDDITPVDISAGNWAGFEITNNILYEVIPSNQLLRPWDNVPRKAKAQEIVGNRIVYGNYLQNYTLTTPKPLIKGRSTTISKADEDRPLPSLKSDREYSVGVVFIDEYGRETPVFSNNKAGFKVPITAASSSNRIIAKGLAAPPGGFSYYKYFVKDSSAQYYNLAVDRIFKSNDGLTAWLGFPSVERNKITIEDTLIFKKGHNNSEQIMAVENRYKVLAIENNAPTDIRVSKQILKTISVGFGENLGDTVNYGFLQLASTPAPGSTAFVIVSENGGAGVSDEAIDLLKPGVIIKFTNTTSAATSASSSKFYKVINVVSETTNNTIKIFVEKPFSNDIRFLYNDSDALITTSANLIEIYGEVDNENDIKFQGKFFVQVENNQTLKDNVFGAEQTAAVNGGKVFPFDNITYNAATDTVTSTGGPRIDSYEDSSFIYLQMWGGGVGIGRGGVAKNYNGGHNHPKMPLWANEGSGNPGGAGNFMAWQVIWERRTNRPTDGTLWSQLGAVGTKIKFSNHAAEYTIKGAREWEVPGESLTRLYTYLDRALEATVNPNFLGVAVNVIILDQVENEDSTTSNPAVFETEPKELADLNLYYEASPAYPISEFEDEKLLSWFNCFSFGNGIESDRARDLFNAPFIDKGTKASTILEEPYEEERRYSGLIYSGIYNSTSGLNSLNQFVQAEKITKDLNPMYGSIQKLHTRDTNLVALCEDKCLRILANKDALFNADGNSNVTSNNNVLGQAVPFAGEFGISKNPESFASYGYRAYFSDKKRSAVLRLSMDGLTEISSKGMVDYFYDNLKAATTVLGSYDIYSDAYTLTLNNDTVCFKEATDGWPTRKSFIPEFGISLNSDYYTMSNGMLWAHDNPLRNTFYEGAVAKSSVKLIFNDIPSKIKNFKTLSYEGDSGWTSPLIQTDQQDGAVTTFLDKENIYYNYIRGLGDTWDNTAQSGTLDLKQFAAQGIGNIVNARNADNTGDYASHTTFTVTVKNDPLN